MDSSHLYKALEEERVWIEKSKRDSRAFEPLYNKYYDTIFRFIYRRTDDEQLAADICSQTFFKALSNIKKFTWQGKPLAAWLYRIASNEIKRHFRDKREIFLIEEDRLIAAEEISDKWAQIKQSNRLTEVLDSLSETDVRILELKYFEGQTFAEIGLILDMKESALKMRLYRLLDKMKLTLSKYVEV